MSTKRREFRLRVETEIRRVLAGRELDDLGLELDLIDTVMAAYDQLCTGKSGARQRDADSLFVAPGSTLDLAVWPEDVRPVIAAVCRLWRLSPPRKGRAGGPYAQWIRDARDLLDACGAESPVRVLESVRASFEQYMQKNAGVAPFTVSGPGSLVKAARFKAGCLWGGSDGKTVAQDEWGGIWV
jgi:hypothetical protein